MVEITWLGHGCFQFRLDSGEVLVLDPWVDGNPAYPKEHKFDRIDTMLITHGHFDHIHDAVPLAKKFKPKVIAIFETCVWLTSKGVENCSGMNKGGTQDVGPVKVTMTHAVHSCGIQDGDQIIYGGEAAGYVLHLADHRKIYFSGDTNVFSDMQLIEKLYQPGPRFSADRGFLHDGPARSRPGVPSAQCQAGNPNALRNFPRADRQPGRTFETAAGFPAYESLAPGNRQIGEMVAHAPTRNAV